ncbi:hypothetical protein V2I29_03180 [Campylobacter sp. CX2-8023-23]|uniref:hypothetical protein n=1 Tax=Campylobacter porcelli TaxID=1660073 RepID=UPI002ECC79D3|nr:hypothetical protein [Campylobacter sp. CX2-8023-23]
MTTIHDLKLGSNTLEVLEVILKSLEAFPDEIAKLDLSKFTKIASDIDKSYQNVQTTQKNVTAMKEAISQTKRLIDEIKSQMDNKLNTFNADFLSTKEIKEVILQTQSAINGVKRQIDAIKSGFDSSYAEFNTKKEKFDKKSTEVNQNLANFNAKKDDFTNMANEANRQITNLQGMVENATNSLTELLNNVNSSVDTANTKKDNLDASIQTANTTKQELEVIARNTENLVNNAADELKNRISTAVNEKVSSVTGVLKNEILTQTDEKLNLKANQATTYTKTEVDSKLGLKADKSTTYTKAETNNLLNTKLAVATYNTDKATFATKTELNTKSNSNAVVNLTGNQTIAGVKTFSAPPVSARNPTANNQVANKAYVDSVGNAKVALTKYNSEVLIPLTANLVWSVGTTGKSGASKHFNSIDLAINEALKYRQTPSKYIDLYLTSDITVPSQLYYYGVDLKHLRIQGGRSASNAGFKIIAGANLNANRSDRYIFYFERSHTPIFVGVTFKGNWVPNTTPRPTGMKAGAKADNGIRVSNGSYLQTSECRFENLNNATLITYNSKACLYGSISSIENCNVGVFTHDNTNVIVHNTTILNTNIAVKSHALARVYLYRGSISKCSLGLEVRYGGNISTNGTTLALQTDATNKNTSDANVAYSAVTNHGIIFKN